MMRKFQLVSLAGVAMMLAAGAAAQSGGETGNGEWRGKGPRPMFALIDSDGDGAVTEAEMMAFQRERFTKLDRDGDGRIVESEMHEAQASMRSERRQTMAGNMFNRLDANSDGTVSREEFDVRADAMPMRGKMRQRMRNPE